MAFFVLFGFSLVFCAYGRVLALLVYTFCVQGLGHISVPPAGHALWAEVGGGITFVTSGRECLAAQKKLPTSIFGTRDSFMKGQTAVYASLSGTAQSPWL